MIDFRDVVLILILTIFLLILVTRGIVVNNHKTLCDEHKIVLLDGSFYKCELIAAEHNNAKVSQP